MVFRCAVSFQKNHIKIPDLSLPPCISKVLEKIVAEKLINHLLTNDLLYVHQYGFLPKRSTEHNLLHWCLLIFGRRRNKDLLLLLLLMLEGSRSGSGSGSIPLTNGTGSGSGSRRPKNTWIRGIWIRIRIRIRNTAVMCILNFLGHKFFDVIHSLLN